MTIFYESIYILFGRFYKVPSFVHLYFSVNVSVFGKDVQNLASPLLPMETWANIMLDHCQT